MVRLKAFILSMLALTSSVSIPYGTIKSRCVVYKFYTSFVSIPYGTIKSVICCIFFVVENRVSIPYGTIKSLNLQKNKSLILLPLRYYKDRKNKRIKCRCPIIMKCRFIDTILNV